MAIPARRPRGHRVAAASLRAALLAEFLAFQSRVGADGVTVVLSEAASSTCAAAPSYRLSHFPRETSRHPAPHTGCCPRLPTLSHGWISAFTLLGHADASLPLRRATPRPQTFLVSPQARQRDLLSQSSVDRSIYARRSRRRRSRTLRRRARRLRRAILRREIFSTGQELSPSNTMTGSLRLHLQASPLPRACPRAAPRPRRVRRAAQDAPPAVCLPRQRPRRRQLFRSRGKTGSSRACVSWCCMHCCGCTRSRCRRLLSRQWRAPRNATSSSCALTTCARCSCL